MFEEKSNGSFERESIKLETTDLYNLYILHELNEERRGISVQDVGRVVDDLYEYYRFDRVLEKNTGFSILGLGDYLRKRKVRKNLKQDFNITLDECDPDTWGYNLPFKNLNLKGAVEEEIPLRDTLEKYLGWDLLAPRKLNVTDEKLLDNYLNWNMKGGSSRKSLKLTEFGERICKENFIKHDEVVIDLSTYLNGVNEGFTEKVKELVKSV